MITALKGRVHKVKSNYVILNVKNVYYKIDLLKKDYEHIQQKGWESPSEELLLHVLRHGADHYGFLSEEGKEKFAKLCQESNLSIREIYNLSNLDNPKEILQRHSQGERANSLDKLEEAREALKELGYNKNMIEEIISSLTEEEKRQTIDKLVVTCLGKAKKK